MTGPHTAATFTAPDWTDALYGSNVTPLPTATEVPTGRHVRVTLASQIKPRPVTWLWPGRIPAGALTLLGGREGIGKSLIAVWLTAQLTAGTLPGSRHGKPSRVLIATSEDAWEYTVVPRLIAAGADLDLVGRVEIAEDGLITGLTLPVDADGLTAYMRDKDVALLALDPLTSVMDGRIDAHRDREVRTALEPLGRIGEDTGAAVVGLVHIGKAAGVDPVNLILGSRAFSAVARLVLVAARDPDDEDSNIVSVEKSNLGRRDLPALTYQVDGAQVATDEGPAETGVLKWTGETDRQVRDIYAGPDGEHSETREAAAWLAQYLADCGGEADSNDAKAAGKRAGFAERTVQRAREKAGVTTHRIGFGKDLRSMWRLGTPDDAH